MNLLPLVFAFLLIFASLATAFLQDAKGSFLLESSLEGHHRTARAVTNHIAKKAYGKIKSDTTKPKEQTSTPTKQANYESRRSFFPPLEDSKLHLAPLLKATPPYSLHPLFEPTLHYLRTLYQKNLFSQYKREEIAAPLLEALLTKASALETVENWIDLMPEEKELAELFYKMLQGTNRYDSNLGIPPFGECFSLKNEKSALYLSFASPSLLEAFFGKETKEKILAKEKAASEKKGSYVYLTKEEFKQLLLENPSSAIDFTKIEPLINESKQLKRRDSIGGKDTATGITVIRKQTRN